MRLVDYAQRHRIVVGALAGLVVGTALGLAQPIRASAPDPAELADWTPYDRATLARYDETTFARVRDRAIWSGSVSGTGNPGAKAAAQWRLAGIVDGPAPMALVYAAGDDAPLRVVSGDTLPDGGEVVEVTRRAVRFTRARCEYERALYSPVDLAVEDCAARP